MSERKYVAPPQILISSQAFLLERMGKLPQRVRWGIGDYLQAAEDFGVRVMYEPVRGIWSKARRELVKSQTSGAGISMLAEPARSEVSIRDFDPSVKRILFQTIFAILESHRFNQSEINFLVKLQQAISPQEKPIPVRVYEARPGFHSAILEKGLKNKIYAQNHGEVMSGVLEHMQGVDEKDRIVRIVQEIIRDVEQYQVSGIELNILGLMAALRHHPHLIFGVVRALLERTTPNTEGSALVQSVVVQPNRIDLLEDIELSEMEQVLKILAECGFAGSIIYALGGGSDKTQEIVWLKTIFPNY